VGSVDLTKYRPLSILEPMATSTHAKLFRNGGSQAVRLPKGCRFPEDQTEVLVRRDGRRVILEPVDAWPKDFVACLGAWPEEIERPNQASRPGLKDPFR
jgi:antitoxin VapB